MSSLTEVEGGVEINNNSQEKSFAPNKRGGSSVVMENKPLKMCFVSKIVGARDPRDYTPAQFNRMVTERKFKPDFTLMERFDGDSLVHPYFDWDAKLTKEEMPATEEGVVALKEQHLKDFKGLVERLFPNRTVEYAQRHGVPEGQAVYKISYRAFVLGVKVKVNTLRTYIEHSNVPKELDVSVYKAGEQLLGVPFGCKDTDKEKRYLVPLDKTSPPNYFLAQDIQEGDEEFKFEPTAALVKTAKKRVAKKKVPRESPAVGPTEAPTEAPLRPGEITATDDILAAANECARKLNVQEEVNQMVDERGAKSCLVFPLTTRWCLIKGGLHAQNHPLLVLTLRGGFKYTCHDEDCKRSEVAKSKKFRIPFAEVPRLLQALFPSDKVTTDIINTEASDVIGKLLHPLTILSHSEDPEINRLMYEAMTGETKKIAYLAIRLLAGKAVCLNRKNWFQFADHIWVPLAGPPTDLISDLLEEELFKYWKVLGPFLGTLDQIHMKRFDTVFTTIARRVMDWNWRTGLTKEMEVPFDRQTKSWKFDERTHLVAFNNGVYDLETETFGDGKPEYLLTKKLPHNYLPELDNDARLFIENFLEEIVPADDDRKFLIRRLATCLDRTDAHQSWTVLSGVGRNGKGALMRLMIRCLSIEVYCRTPPASVLTSVRPSSNQASSDLIDLKYQRMLMLSEPDGGAKIVSSMWKLLTGGDPQRYRKNHHNEETWEQTATCFLLCNDIPKFDEETAAVWLRTAIIRFPNLFVPEPNPDKPEERLLDPLLEPKLAEMAPHMLRYLIEEYKAYRADGCKLHPITASMKREIAEQQEESNPIRLFKNQCIDGRKGSEVCVPKMLERFNKWREVRNEEEGGDLIKRLGASVLSSQLGKLGLARGGKSRLCEGHTHPNPVQRFINTALIPERSGSN